VAAARLVRGRPKARSQGPDSRPTDADLHIVAVTIGELQAGVELTREQDPERAAEIEVWAGRVEPGSIFGPF
jgi:hypothetical protein